MTLDEFRKTSQVNFCEGCLRQTHIQVFSGHQFCFICSHTPGITILDQQHRVLLAAMTLTLDTLKPPKKPRQPKTEGPSVHPMRPRKR